MSNKVNGHVENAHKKEEIWVMYNITVSRGRDSEEKNTIFVNPTIYVVENIGKDPHYELVFENRSDIEDLTKRSRYKEARDGTKTAVRIKDSRSATDITRIVEYLRRIHQVDTPQELTAVLNEGGLNQSEMNNIMVYRDENRELLGYYIKIGLEFYLNKNNELDSIDLHFEDRRGRRISSIKTIYPVNNYIFGRMKIGPRASHRPNDEMVVREIHCRHCYRKLATGTIAELAASNQLVDLCDGCQDIYNLERTENNKKDPDVERTYVISGKASIVDNLEVLFREITILSNTGASREIKLYIDGDGAVNIDVKRKDGKELSKNCHRHGYLKRERYYGDSYENGYLTYLDLG